MAPIWQVRLFNGPILVSASGEETRRFRSHKVGALLAYLALHLDRPCPREELYEALWPEEETRLAANRFRVALASLRRHLEPEGVQFGSVLDVSGPGRVRLRGCAVSCDVGECERLLRAGRAAQAAQFMTGSLLPGFYEEWAVAEQARYELLALDVVPISGMPRSSMVEAEAPTRSLLPELTSRISSELSSELTSQITSETTFGFTSEYIPDAEAHNALLPLYLTRFFGRERELQTLRELICSQRQVSLIGMGGMGKTRLAAALARTWKGACVFVSLVSLPDAERLYDAVLRALGVAPLPDAPTDAQLIRVLGRRAPLLLIVDNAEHLSDAVAAMTLRLLAEVPDLRLLVTSRQRLNIAGESVLLLAPLDAPQLPAQTERLLEFASVSLFVDRAKIARPDFAFSERNAPAVVSICRQLEGIPLALELAAARITSQTPQQIAQSLEHSLTDLKAHQRGLSPRHQSLRAVIEGSLALLTAAQQEFFLALSVFRGGWTHSAAQAVTLCEQADEFLNDLTLCSLIVAREDEQMGTMRYILLETLRQYAARSLDTEQLDIYRERCARFYMDMATAADQEDFRFMNRMEADHDNIMQAMEWYWQHDRATLMPLLKDVLNMWANQGRHRLALEWGERAFPETAVASKPKQALFRIYADVGWYEEAEHLARLAARDMDTPLQTTQVYSSWGYLRMLQGVWDEAVECQRRALVVVYNIADEQRGILIRHVASNTALALLGRAVYLADNPAALEDFREAERCTREGYANIPQDSRLTSAYHWHLMCALWGQNREEEGDVCFARALETALAHCHSELLMKIMGDGAFRLAAKGYGPESVQMFSVNATLREKMGYCAPLYFEARVEEHLQALRTQLGQETFDRNWECGIYTPLEVLVPAVLPKILARKILDQSPQQYDAKSRS